MIDKSFLSKFELSNLARTHDLSEGIVKAVEQAEKGQIIAEDFPYEQKIGRKKYEAAKRKMQVELVKMQNWMRKTGQKLVLVFEGRDAAGKGGTIKRFMEHLNPRYAKVIALAKPSELESGQWYLQRLSLIHI